MSSIWYCWCFGAGIMRNCWGIFCNGVGCYSCQRRVWRRRSFPWLCMCFQYSCWVIKLVLVQLYTCSVRMWPFPFFWQTANIDHASQGIPFVTILSVSIIFMRNVTIFSHESSWDYLGIFYWLPSVSSCRTFPKGSDHVFIPQLSFKREIFKSTVSYLLCKSAFSSLSIGLCKSSLTGVWYLGSVVLPSPVCGWLDCHSPMTYSISSSFH